VNDKEAAKMLGVSRRTIWRMEADRQLEAVRIRGCTRFRVVEIKALQEGKTMVEAL